MSTDDEPVAADNPAGRVLAFLNRFRAAMPRNQDNAMVVLMDVLSEEQESARIYLLMTQLRIQAESVPKRMAPYAKQPGYGGYEEHYPQILDAAKRLQSPAGQRAQDIFVSVDGGGWSALRFASEVLSYHRADEVLTKKRGRDYLAEVQDLIGTIARDEALLPADRQRIVDALRNVEQALLDVEINGAGAVRDAAAAATFTSLTLRKRVGQMPWYQRLGAVLVAIAATAEFSANGLAIEQYFNPEPPQIVVVSEHDSDRAVEGRVLDGDEETPR